MRPDKQPVHFPDQSLGQHPSIDLNVSLSELWPGCPTVLVDVTPAYLIHNTCHCDLVVMGNEDITYDLGQGQTISPPKLEVGFARNKDVNNIFTMGTLPFCGRKHVKLRKLCLLNTLTLRYGYHLSCQFYIDMQHLSHFMLGCKIACLKKLYQF